MNAIKASAMQNAEVTEVLQRHVATGVGAVSTAEKEIELKVKIAKIEENFKIMINEISNENADDFDENRAKQLLEEKKALERELQNLEEEKRKSETEKRRKEDIVTVVDGIKNRSLKYDERLVRQLIECVVVESQEKIKVIFKGGLEAEQNLYE